MLADDILRDVSRDLNDQEQGYEYTTYTKAQLSSYLQEALDYVSQILKDKFLSRKVVELAVGDVWQEACSCTRITRILGETNESGTRILKRLRRVDDVEENEWLGTSTPSCSSASGAQGIESYSISSTDPTSFRIVPPVSPASGRKRYVLLECYEKPDVSTSGYDVPEEAVIIAKQWMLYRALIVDSENNKEIQQVAATHLQAFQKLLDDQRQLVLMEKAVDGDGGNVRSVPDSSSE